MSMQIHLGVCTICRLFSLRVSKHVATDCSFLELLPNLYKNEMTELVVNIPCTSTFNPTHKCSGPACVTIRVTHLHFSVQRTRLQWQWMKIFYLTIIYKPEHELGLETTIKTNKFVANNYSSRAIKYDH